MTTPTPGPTPGPAPGPAPRVLVIGLDPSRIPGFAAAEAVSAAVARGIDRFAEHGVGVEACLFGLDGSDDVEAVVTAALASRPWECVVVGGGVRKPDELVELLERIVYLVGRHAPGAAIAFNRNPTDTFEAAARWIELPADPSAAAGQDRPGPV